MTAPVSSLWPDDIKVDVLPPLAILRIQAAQVEELTKGRLHGEVTTVTGPDDFASHRLDLIATALDGRRDRILTATHRTEFYPVVIEARVYLPNKIPAQAVRDATLRGMAAAMGVDTRTEYPLRDWPPVDDWRPVASNQDELLKRISEILRSSPVRATIDSLLALINEKSQPADADTAA